MNYVVELKAANVIGGKTARACDCCLRKRARWFCAEDDAFLCQACEASVHSANQLAGRHERVRFETSSFKGDQVMNSCPSPAWHQGFTRKARTPRHAKSKQLHPPPNNPLPLVPENINGEDPFTEENEEQLLCRVPFFDHFLDDFRTEETRINGSEEDDHDQSDLNLAELLNCDIELEEYAANVESLLVAGSEEYSAGGNSDFDSKTMKAEDEDVDEETKAVIACHFDPALDMEMKWDLDYACSSIAAEDGEEMKKEAYVESTEDNIESKNQIKKMMLLSLNYEAVMTDWATRGSPWTTGVRPHELNPDALIMIINTSLDRDSYGGRWGSAHEIAKREARVSRYREKRRTRLFAKKIRYQVRKINAEKRPRMKGRFVKRASFLGSSSAVTPPYLMKK